MKSLDYFIDTILLDIHNLQQLQYNYQNYKVQDPRTKRYYKL